VNEQQFEDENIMVLINWLKEKIAGANSMLPDNANSELKSYFAQLNKFQLINRNVYKAVSDDENGIEYFQYVVPVQQRENVLQRLHNDVLSGHFGRERTIERVRERFYWPGFIRYITEYVEKCHVCALAKAAPVINEAPYEPIRATSPFQLIAMDLKGPLPQSANGFVYILVCSPSML
jgi:hypothetical protein